MKVRTMTRWFPALLTMFGVFAISTDARAGVSNPDTYDIQMPSGLDSIYSGAGHTFNLIGPTPAPPAGTVYGTLTGPIDSSGNWSYDNASFPTVATSETIGIYAVSAQLQVSASGTSGVADPGTGEVTLTLHARFVFTGGWLTSGGCSTPYFNATVSTRKTWLDSSSGVDFNTTYGTFRANAADFAIGAITSGCVNSTNRNAINAYWGFDGHSGSIGMKFDTGQITSPQLLAP